LGLDLTIGLIHRAIDTKNPMLAPLQKKPWLKMFSTEKSLVVSFWTFFKFLGNQGELEKTETTKNFY